MKCLNSNPCDNETKKHQRHINGIFGQRQYLSKLDQHGMEADTKKCTNMHSKEPTDTNTYILILSGLHQNRILFNEKDRNNNRVFSNC